MALDPVPWFVGGGAVHSPEVARLLAYASTSGAEGVIEPGNAKVIPLSVPGGAVQIVPGAALIRNRASGGTQQTYVARVTQAEQVEIAPTGSSGGRRDLIVLQVEDPNMAGEPWQTPENREAGPYVFARVISDVPAGTKRLQDVQGYEGRSAVTLARIDLPASTGTVTADMITSLRNIALPRRETVMFTYDAPDDRRFKSGSTDWDGWPLQGSDSMGLWDTVTIPEWATYYQCLVTYTSVKSKGDTYGYVRLLLGTGANQQSIQGSFNTVNAAASEVTNTFQASNKGAVPAAFRGTTQEMRLQGRLASASIPAAAGPWASEYTRVVVQWDFAERAA